MSSKIEYTPQDRIMLRLRDLERDTIEIAQRLRVHPDEVQQRFKFLDDAMAAEKTKSKDPEMLENALHTGFLNTCDHYEKMGRSLEQMATILEAQVSPMDLVEALTHAQACKHPHAQLTEYLASYLTTHFHIVPKILIQHPDTAGVSEKLIHVNGS